MMYRMLKDLKARKRYLKDTITFLILINMMLAIVALLRDIFLASYLGTSFQADALVLALFLPDTVGNNLLAASIGVACVPVFSRLFIKNKMDQLFLCLRNLTVSFLMGSFILLALFYVLKGELVGVLGKGLSLEAASLCLKLFCIIMPTIVLFPLVTIGSSIMQVFNHFVIPGLAPLLFNWIFLGAIISVCIFHIPAGSGVYIVASSITAGVSAMVLMIWISVLRLFFKKSQPEMSRKNFKFPTTAEFMDLKNITTIFFPYLLIMLSAQSVLAVERYLASNLGVGTIAGLNYAYRIAQFPVWVFVAAVSVVILPSMSKLQGLGYDKNLRETFTRALWLVLVITLPLSISLFFLREPIIAILLQRGTFDYQSLHITSGILAGYSLTVVSQGMAVIGLRFFMAQGKMVCPLLVFVLSALINIGADIFLVKKMGSGGLGYGAAAGAFFSAGMMYYFIQRELEIDLQKQAAHAARMAAANLPVTLIVLLCGKVWYMLNPEVSYTGKLIYALFVAMFVLTAYFFSIRRFKILERKI